MAAWLAPVHLRGAQAGFMFQAQRHEAHAAILQLDRLDESIAHRLNLREFSGCAAA